MRLKLKEWFFSLKAGLQKWLDERMEILRNKNISLFLLHYRIYSFSLKTHEIDIYQTLFYEVNLRRFGIRAFDWDAFRFCAFYFIQFDGSVNVSKADHNPAFDKYIGYLLLCCLLRFFKSEILSSIIPLTSICTCNEWNRINNFFLLLLCHYYVNNVLLAFSRF